LEKRPERKAALKTMRSASPISEVQGAALQGGLTGFHPRRVTFDLFAANPVLHEDAAIAGLGPVRLPQLVEEPGAQLTAFRMPDGEPWKHSFTGVEGASAFHFQANLADFDVPRFAPSPLDFKASFRGFPGAQTDIQ
jgi:hypothetical protein